MKYSSRSLGFALLLLGSGTAMAGERIVTLAVANMYCDACPLTVKKSITAVPGVTKVEVSYEKKTAVVTFDDAKATIESLAEASTKAGYPAKLAAATKGS